ncbi:unnamed protein product [Ophioblennius macclurei]
MDLAGDNTDRNDEALRDEQQGEGDEGNEGESRPEVRIGTPLPARKKRRKDGKSGLWINLTCCKFESVRRAARRCGIREAMEGEDWTLFWSDSSVSRCQLKDMKPYQKINHFLGMNEICRKDFLARNMKRMGKLFPKEYNIFPRTWCLPADYSEFQVDTWANKKQTYICKPPSGCQGQGIFITNSTKDIQCGEPMICQVYITRPFTLDGFKFDLRIYVLVTACDPFSIFMFKEGLARFCTTKYNKPTNGNMEDKYMHLANYSINKQSQNFVRDRNNGSKRKLSTLTKQLESMSCNTEKMWNDIEDIIIKTLISIHPILKQSYHACFPNHTVGSACFEILGFDVLLDHQLKPWLLEVNHSPSFTTDSQLDREVKNALLYDTLVLINLGACNRRAVTLKERRRVMQRLLKNQSRGASLEELRRSHAATMEQMGHYEAKHLGGFKRIYPREGGQKYDKYFEQSSSLLKETAASIARKECIQQKMRLKEQKEQEQRPGSRKDLQGEKARKRVLSIPQGGAEQQATGADQLSRMSPHPEDAEVRGEEEEDKEKDLDNEDQQSSLDTLPPFAQRTKLQQAQIHQRSCNKSNSLLQHKPPNALWPVGGCPTNRHDNWGNSYVDSWPHPGINMSLHDPSVLQSLLIISRAPLL